MQEIINENLFLLSFITIFLLISITMYKGMGDNRTIVIYEDYNDLGLSFFAPFSGVFTFMILSNIEFLKNYALIVSFTIMIILLLRLVVDTYISNNKNIIKTFFAYFTKVVLAITLVFHIFNVFNPSGDSEEERSSSMWSSIFFLIIFIPLIKKLIVKNRGSKINPFEWIRPRTQYSKI